jgi:hypothetical protein
MDKQRCWECQKECFSAALPPDSIEQSGLCWDCNFWYEKIILANYKQVARINGRHYVIEDEAGDTIFGFRGFNGQEFTIKFFDGRVVKTTNLWFQGVIPERFRDRLPDNAEFVGIEPLV